jgi:hypothetical protein
MQAFNAAQAIRVHSSFRAAIKLSLYGLRVAEFFLAKNRFFC